MKSPTQSKEGFFGGSKFGRRAKGSLHERPSELATVSPPRLPAKSATLPSPSSAPPYISSFDARDALPLPRVSKQEQLLGMESNRPAEQLLPWASTPSPSARSPNQPSPSLIAPWNYPVQVSLSSLAIRIYSLFVPRRNPPPLDPRIVLRALPTAAPLPIPPETIPLPRPRTRRRGVS